MQRNGFSLHFLCTQLTKTHLEEHIASIFSCEDVTYTKNSFMYANNMIWNITFTMDVANLKSNNDVNFHIFIRTEIKDYDFLLHKNKNTRKTHFFFMSIFTVVLYKRQYHKVAWK